VRDNVGSGPSNRCRRSWSCLPLLPSPRRRVSGATRPNRAKLFKKPSCAAASVMGMGYLLEARRPGKLDRETLRKIQTALVFMPKVGLVNRALAKTTR
jgi:hypothetical protein